MEGFYPFSKLDKTASIISIYTTSCMSRTLSLQLFRPHLQTSCTSITMSRVGPYCLHWKSESAAVQSTGSRRQLRWGL